ncbi:MAG: transposase [Cytophagales bacterium]|nr:transposase [Cytophagales bacterium]
MDIIGWGKRLGRQRFKCKNCGIFFTRNDPGQRLENRFTWFGKWILERQTFKTLSRDSGLSIDTLQRTFYTYLDESPDVKILKRERVHLRIDATYFKRFCALCYQDHEDGYTQLVRFSDGEHFEEIREDLTNLIRLGVHIESITTDGHKSILKAIKKSLPDAIVQRCLVHIQRMCLLWLTRFPKHLAGIELRQLVLQIMAIKTENDRLYWTRQFSMWHERHKVYLLEKTFNQSTGRYWYTHKLLRRSYLTIKRALPNMFHYLTNPKIPATTNGIEGFFSHLKNHLDLHRGLTLKHRVNFIKWYVYLSNHK